MDFAVTLYRMGRQKKRLIDCSFVRQILRPGRIRLRIFIHVYFDSHFQLYLRKIVFVSLYFNGLLRIENP